MPGLERQFRPVYFALLGTFMLFGVSVGAIGATLPKVLEQFGWSYLQTGCVLAAGSIGYFAATFASGLLAARLGTKRVMVAGMLLQAAGMLAFVRWPSVWLNVAVYFFVGVGQGGEELVTNYAVVRMQRDGRSRLMNLMHAAFTVGAIIGPLVAAALIGCGRSGREIYGCIGAACLALAWLHGSLDYRVLGAPEEAGRATTRAAALLREPLLVLPFLVMLLYVGSELGVSNWVGEYYVKVLGASPAAGAYVVGVFWFGLLVGRAGLSFFYHGRGQAGLLLLLGSGATAALYLAIFMPGPLSAGAGFLLAGLGYSAVYPLVVVLVGRQFPADESFVVGVVTTGGGIGSFSFPFFMAAISQHFGIWTGFLFFVGVNVVSVALMAAIFRLVRARTAGKAGGEANVRDEHGH